MFTTIEVYFLDTESNEVLRGELIDPFRIQEDGIALVGCEDGRPESVTVATAAFIGDTDNFDIRFHKVETQFISALIPVSH